MAGGAGRKVWTRETLSAPDLQSYIQDQVVMRFPSASARDAVITAPTEGMVTTLDDRDVIERHDGTRWRKIAGPPELILELPNVAGTTVQNGQTGIGVSCAVPVHGAGNVLYAFSGSWTSTTNAAALTDLFVIAGGTATLTGAINVPGTQDRQHNNGQGIVTQKVIARGWLPSDGSAKQLMLRVRPDAGGGPVTISAASWQAWLQ